MGRTPPLTRARRDDLPAPLVRWFAHPRPAPGDGLAIAGVGVREWMAPGRVERLHGTGDWLIMVFHQGVELGLDGGWRAVAGRCLMLWPPGAPQRYGQLQGPWLHSWLHVSGPAIAGQVAALQLPCAEPLPDIAPALIERTAEAVHREVTSWSPADPLIVHHLLEILLHEIARALRPAPPPVPAALLAVKRQLESRFHEPTSLAELARLCGWSAHHFCSEFHRHLGASPIDFLIRLRLEHARWLLRDRNRSVLAVARAVGYEDPRTFARLCRRRLGCSPSQLRSAT